MQHVDQILHADWIIPVEPSGVTLADHCVAILGDRIIDVLPSALAEHNFTADHEIALQDHVLIPGLINCHAHAAMTLFRGLADDLPLEPWLEEHIWPAEARCVDRNFVHDGSLLAASEMLRSGTTCFNDMYFYPEVQATVVKEVGIRAK